MSPENPCYHQYSESGVTNQYGYKIAALGGGTGLFNLLRGLIRYNRSELITAIPGTWDSGGSSGKLRTELGILPPGDARRCLIALMPDDEQREIALQLFESRLEDGHSIGNLVLAELDKAYQGHIPALGMARKLFRVKGNIEPVSVNKLTLIAKYAGGKEEYGEHLLDDRHKNPDFNPDIPVSSVYFSTRAIPNHGAIKALSEAEKTVIAMGSLNGSIRPHFQVPGVSYAINQSDAELFYILNITTEKGQTDSLRRASDHLKYILRGLGERDRLDCMIVNDNNIDDEIMQIYEEEGQYKVEIDYEECFKLAPNLKIIASNVANYSKTDHLLRHDPGALAMAILNPASHKIITL